MPALTRRRGALLVLACALAVPPPADAQLRSATLQLENDAYDFWIPAVRRPDHDYTNGLAVALELEGAPLWGHLLAPQAPPCGGEAARCTRTRLTVGQKIFTPLLHDAEPVPGERPFAGWLYAEAGAAVLTPHRARELGVQVGVTGAPSLAGAVQATWHHLAGFYPVRGWDHQLGFEPAFMLRYRHRVLLADAGAPGARVLALTPAWGADLGTTRVAAQAGAEAMAGLRVPDPWFAAAGAGRSASLYAAGAVWGDAVARDLFLDGSTWRRSVRAGHRPLVWEAELGAGARYRGLSLEYRAVTRGREYAAQPEPHTWGRFTLAWRH